MGNLREKAKAGAQLSYAASGGTGSYQAFSGTLTETTPVLIFDNQTSVPVSISDDGITTWKTFSAGEALVLDLNTNHDKQATILSWPIGTQFYANSAAGTGSFYISPVYTQ